MSELHDALTDLFTTIYTYAEGEFKRTLSVKSALPRSNYPYSRPVTDSSAIYGDVVIITNANYGFQNFLPGGPLISSSGDSYILIKASSTLFTSVDWETVKEVYITNEWTGKETKEMAYEVMEKFPVGTSSSPIGIILLVKRVS